MMKFSDQHRPCHSESFAALKDKLREESARGEGGFFAPLRMTVPGGAKNDMAGFDRENS
jgi:hypothetical protein